MAVDHARIDRRNKKSILSKLNKGSVNSSKKAKVKMTGSKAKLSYKLKKDWKLEKLTALKTKSNGSSSTEARAKNNGTLSLPKGGYIQLNIVAQNKKTKMSRSQSIIIYNAAYKGKF